MKIIKFDSEENLKFVDAIEETIKYIRDEENLKKNVTEKKLKEIKELDNELYFLIEENSEFDTKKDVGRVVEINFRIWHFFLWDFDDDWDFIDNLNIDDEVREAFRNNIFSCFRIIETTKEYAIIKDLISENTLKITWEFEWSDNSIINLPIWSEIIARIVKYKNEIYSLKIYYYFNTDIEENKYLSNHIIKFFQKSEFKFNLYILEKLFNNIKKISKKKIKPNKLL